MEDTVDCDLLVSKNEEETRQVGKLLVRRKSDLHGYWLLI